MSSAGVHEPNPVGGDVPIADLVMQDIKERVDFGFNKYGTKLMAHNGRKPMWDLFQELIDSIFYARQEIVEKEAETELLCRVYALLVAHPHQEGDGIAESVSLLLCVLNQRGVNGAE